MRVVIGINRVRHVISKGALTTNVDQVGSVESSLPLNPSTPNLRLAFQSFCLPRGS